MLKLRTISTIILLLLVSQSAYTDVFQPSEAVNHERVAEIEMNISRLQQSIDSLSAQLHDQGSSAPGQTVEQIQADLISQGLIGTSVQGQETVTIGVINGRPLQNRNAELFLGEQR